MPAVVYISYSHKDKRWKDDLVSQLAVLEREALLATWHDGLIQAGANWLPAIEAAMAAARVAVFLVSADFLNSGFIRAKEIPPLMARRREEGLRIIPLIARPCPWQEVPWLARLQARPLGGKTLAELGGVKAERVLSELAEEVLRFVEPQAGSASAEPAPQAAAGAFVPPDQAPPAAAPRPPAPGTLSSEATPEAPQSAGVRPRGAQPKREAIHQRAETAGQGNITLQIIGDVSTVSLGRETSPAAARSGRGETAAAVSYANLHQLPSPPADFTGRLQEMEALRHSAMEALRCPAAGEAGAAIFGIYGMGGVGKTALALKLAEEMSKHYPDGQIFVELQGMTAPLTVDQARAQVVRSFRPEARASENEDRSAAAYRSVLYGKRILIVLDDAREAAQVEPLLPPRGCALIVTSRFHFAFSGLLAVDVDELPARDAQELLLRICPRIGAAAPDLARLCGGLPKALHVAGGTLAVRPDVSPSAYIQRLAAGVERLGAVDAALAASSAMLDADLRRLWCVLAVFPATFAAAAAAAVWERDENAAVQVVGELMLSSLVDWDEGVARYRLHDLARSYADRQLDEAERKAARLRHAVHYLGVLGQVDALCRQWGEGVRRGFALFDAEWPNIEAGQSWAAAHPEAIADGTPLCEAYPSAGAYCLVLRLSTARRTGWFETAVASAERRQDRSAQARHLGNLGVAYGDLGNYRRALALHEECLALARETGDDYAEGAALMNLGLTCYALEDHRRAIEFFTLRLDMARASGDLRGQGEAANNLGLAYAGLGAHRRAIELYEECLAFARKTGDRRGTSATLNNLGLAYAAVGETGRAMQLYDQSLAMDREMGDRRAEAQVLTNIGLAHAALGEHRSAIECLEQRLTIARELGDRIGEGDTLGNLGLSYAELGDAALATECYEQQLAIAGETEDRWSQGRASWNLGLIFEGRGDLARALTLMQVLVDLERETGHADAEDDAAQVAAVRARLGAIPNP
jgi:tetratricopeptide (TPR) repeat protein